jgi:anti-sigma B factor antagonist/stage II sporulation protein AA (anti-sigma F factor antagonist)
MSPKSIGTLELEERGPTIVARIAGELDLSNVDDTEATIVLSVTPDTKGLVIDLTGTTFLDSTGIRMIFQLAGRLRSRRHQLRLVADETTLVHRVLVLSQLDSIVPVDSSLAAALAAAEDGSS